MLAEDKIIKIDASKLSSGELRVLQRTLLFMLENKLKYTALLEAYANLCESRK